MISRAGWGSARTPFAASENRGQDGAGIGEVGQHRVRSGCRQFVGGIVAGSYGDDSGPTRECRGYIVRGVADQHRASGLVVLAVGLLGSLAGDTDEVRADVVVRAKRADVQVEVPS